MKLEVGTGIRTLEVRVPGPAVPKPRMTRRDQWLRPMRDCVRRYYAWKDVVKFTTIEEAKKYQGIPHDGPVMLDITFYFEQGDKVATLHTKKPDIDNLVKAVMEALTGVVYIDDCQVAVCCATKMNSDLGGNLSQGGAKIMIRLVTP